MAFFGHVATFFTFAAFILMVFSMVGTLYDRPFVKDLFFLKLYSGSDFIIFGLWSYCTGSNNTVSTCSTPVAAFDWSKSSGLGSLISDMHSLEHVFTVNFILYWIALGLTFIALVITIMSHFRRGPDLCASIATFLAFIVMLVVFVIVFVLSVRGIKIAKDNGSNVGGYLGPSTWMTLGAFVALLFSSFGYCIACICGPGRVRSQDKV